MKLAEYFTRRIKSTEGYEMVVEQVRFFFFAVFYALKAENFLARISEHLLLVCAAKFENIGRKGEKGATGKGCLIVRFNLNSA